MQFIRKTPAAQKQLAKSLAPHEHAAAKAHQANRAADEGSAPAPPPPTQGTGSLAISKAHAAALGRIADAHGMSPRDALHKAIDGAHRATFGEGVDGSASDDGSSSNDSSDGSESSSDAPENQKRGSKPNPLDRGLQGWAKR